MPLTTHDHNDKNTRNRPKWAMERTVSGWIATGPGVAGMAIMIHWAAQRQARQPFARLDDQSDVEAQPSHRFARRAITITSTGVVL